MATETTLVYLGHLLVNNILKDLCRKQNQLCQTHSLVLENIWFDNFEKKSLIHQGNDFLMQFSYFRVNYRLYHL